MISNLFDNTDVLLIASQTFESFGFNSIEAMAHKVPGLETKVVGIPEVVVSCKCGYCVDKNDVDSYADRIIKLIEDENLRKEQVQQGYKRFLDLPRTLWQ